MDIEALLKSSFTTVILLQVHQNQQAYLNPQLPKDYI